MNMSLNNITNHIKAIFNTGTHINSANTYFPFSLFCRTNCCVTTGSLLYLLIVKLKQHEIKVYIAFFCKHPEEENCKVKNLKTKLTIRQIDLLLNVQTHIKHVLNNKKNNFSCGYQLHYQ